MIAKIIKVSKELLDSPEGDDLRGYSYNLPLFSPKLDYAYQKEFSEYVLQLWQINNGGRYPTWIPFLNDDDYEKVNIYWDWVVKEGKDCFEFLL